MRLQKVAVCFGILTACLSFLAPAKAQLLGTDIRTDYLFPTQGAVFQTLGTQTVTAGGALYNSFGQTDYLVTTDQIRITNVFGSNVTFTPAAFNGVSFTEVAGPSPTITGVSIDPSTNLAGLDASRISNNGSQVFVDLQSLTTQPNTLVLLNLSFGQQVPEPGTLVMLVGLVGTSAGVLLRRKR